MFGAVRHILRLLAIARTLARHDALFLLTWAPAGRWVVPAARALSGFRTMRRVRQLRRGQRLALALEALGPTFIKLGQALSTRSDLFGEQMTADLSALQDNLPPFPSRRARATIEAELGQPIDALFAAFEDTPVAAASIAQVHFAVTRTTDGEAGKRVAVKVLRPRVERAFQRDLSLFRWLAKQVERTQPRLRRLKPVASVDTFAESVRIEMDLRLEAAAAAELRENFLGDPTYKVPEVDWARTAQRVMTIERVEGIPIHDTDALVAAGHDVICVDNLFTGSKRNIEHLLDHHNFEFVRHDVTFPFYVEVDEIYNLASPASPIHYQFDPVQTTKTSVHGAINMLGLAKRTRAKILQASTSEVYGDPAMHPQREEYWGNVNPVGPRACYDEAKRCAETLFFDYYRQHGTNIRVVRIFNTYGPRMHPNDGRVVSNFIVQALQDKPISVFGQGSQTRSFCYVDDLIEGMLRMMGAPDDVTGPINVGNPTEFTILELAQQVIELTGSRSTIEYQPLPQDDPTQRQPDIEKATKVLEWRPRTQLREGLLKTIAYFETIIQRPAAPVKLPAGQVTAKAS